MTFTAQVIHPLGNWREKLTELVGVRWHHCLKQADVRRLHHLHKANHNKTKHHRMYCLRQVYGAHVDARLQTRSWVLRLASDTHLQVVEQEMWA